MRIALKAFNEVRRFAAHLPPDGTLEVADRATVQGVLDALEIPVEFQANLVFFRNGRPAFPETTLEDGDHLVVFASMTGG